MVITSGVFSRISYNIRFSINFTSGLISGLLPVVFLVESITLIDSWIGREIDEIIFSLEHFSSGDSIHLKYISHK